MARYRLKEVKGNGNSKFYPEYFQIVNGDSVGWSTINESVFQMVNEKLLLCPGTKEFALAVIEEHKNYKEEITYHYV